MAVEDSLKKLKRMKNTKKNREEVEENSYEDRAEKKKKKKDKKKKRISSEISNIDESNVQQSKDVEDKFSGEKDFANEPGEEQLQKSRKKKKRKTVRSVNRIDEFNKEEDASEQQIDEISGVAHSEHENHISSSEGLNDADVRSSKHGKSKKAAKKKKKSQLLENELSHENLLEKGGEASEDEVYQMSSGDEDSSRGMEKWIMQYHQSRPGLKVLQEKIDDFIVAHEAREEQARKEREAKDAEDGWTVVVHHKGRKKTTDAESGIAVGSVAEAAVKDKMAKKKPKDVGRDFYSFQKKEAHRNEIMMLQSKFEQDKMRIQQMRAARKFRPY